MDFLSYFLKHIYFTVHVLDITTALFFIIVKANMSPQTNLLSLNSILFHITVYACRHLYPNDNKHEWDQTIIHMSSSH